MRFRRPQGRWWTVTSSVVGAAAFVAFTLWLQSTVERDVPPWRIVAALAVAAAGTVVAARVSPPRARREAPARATLLEGVVSLGSMAAYALLLGAFRAVVGVLIGMGIGYIIRAFRGPPTNHYEDEFPLWGDRSAAGLDEDGRRWRTGTP